MQDNIDAILCILADKLIAIEDEYVEKYPHADEVIPDLISDILIAFESVEPHDIETIKTRRMRYNDELEKLINEKWDSFDDSVKVRP